MISTRIIKGLIEFLDTVPDDKGIEFKVYAYCKVKEIEYLSGTMINHVVVLQYRDLQDYFIGGTGSPIERTFGRTNLPPEIQWAINAQAQYPDAFI